MIPKLLSFQSQLIALLLLALLLAACRTPPPSLEQGQIQVGWGEAVYRMECAHCHNTGRVVPLTVTRLVPYRNAENLFQYIRETMPLDEPGALPDYDYWAVTAYLLAASNAPLPEDTILGPDIAPDIGFNHD